MPCPRLKMCPGGLQPDLILPEHDGELYRDPPKEQVGQDYPEPNDRVRRFPMRHPDAHASPHRQRVPASAKSGSSAGFPVAKLITGTPGVSPAMIS